MSTFLNPRNTVITHGYDVYFEESQATIEMFTQSLGEAWCVAKSAMLTGWDDSKTIVIARCKEEAFLESNGKPYEVYQHNSYHPIVKIRRTDQY